MKSRQEYDEIECLKEKCGGLERQVEKEHVLGKKFKTHNDVIEELRGYLKAVGNKNKVEYNNEIESILIEIDHLQNEQKRNLLGRQ